MLKRKSSDHLSVLGWRRGQKDEPTANEAGGWSKAIKELSYFISSRAHSFPYSNIFETVMCLIISSMSYFNWQHVFLSLWYIKSGYVVREGISQSMEYGTLSKSLSLLRSFTLEKVTTYQLPLIQSLFIKDPPRARSWARHSCQQSSRQSPPLLVEHVRNSRQGWSHLFPVRSTWRRDYHCPV